MLALKFCTKPTQVESVWYHGNQCIDGNETRVEWAVKITPLVMFSNTNDFQYN